jgi:hypothetical protein
MNCKPGDMAVVVVGENRGVLCRCLHLSGVSALASVLMGVQGPFWRVELLSRAVNSLDEPLPAGHLALIEDRRLRPIRDPGDDATDETLNWLPVPHKEPA